MTVLRLTEHVAAVCEGFGANKLIGDYNIFRA